MDSVPDLSTYMINNCSYGKRKKIWEAVCDTFAYKLWDHAINDLLCKQPVVKVKKYRSMDDYKLDQKIKQTFYELFEDDSELTNNPVTSSSCKINKQDCEFIVKLPLEKLSKTLLDQLNNKSCLNNNSNDSNLDVEDNVIFIDDGPDSNIEILQDNESDPNIEILQDNESDSNIEILQDNESDSNIEILQDNESHNNSIKVEHETEPSMIQLMHELAIYAGCTTPTYDISSSDDEENRTVISDNVPLDDHESDNHCETNSRNSNMMNLKNPATVTDTDTIQSYCNDHTNTNNKRTLLENTSSVKEANEHHSVRSPPPAVSIAFLNSLLPDISSTPLHDFSSVQASILSTTPTSSSASTTFHPVLVSNNTSTQVHSSDRASTFSSDRIPEMKQQAQLNKLDNSAVAAKQFLKGRSLDFLNKQPDHSVIAVAKKASRKRNLSSARSKQPLKRKLKDFDSNKNNFQLIDSAEYTKYNTVNTTDSIVQNRRKMNSSDVINNPNNQFSIHNNNTNNFSTLKDKIQKNKNDQLYSTTITQSFPVHSTCTSQSQQAVLQRLPDSLQPPFPTPPYQDMCNNYVPEVQKQPLQQQPYTTIYSHPFPSPPYSEYNNSNSNEQTSLVIQNSNTNLQSSISVQKNSIMQHQNRVAQHLQQVVEKEPNASHHFQYQPLSSLHAMVPNKTPLEQYSQAPKKNYNYSLENVLMTEKQQPHPLLHRNFQHSASCLLVPQNSFHNGPEKNLQPKNLVQFGEPVTSVTGQQHIQQQNIPLIYQDQHVSTITKNKSQLQDNLFEYNSLQNSVMINSATKQNASYHSANHDYQHVHHNPLQNCHYPHQPLLQSNLGPSNKSSVKLQPAKVHSNQPVQNCNRICSQGCCSGDAPFYQYGNYSSPQPRQAVQFASYNQTISYTEKKNQNMQNLDYFTSE